MTQLDLFETKVDGFTSTKNGIIVIKMLDGRHMSVDYSDIKEIHTGKGKDSQIITKIKTKNGEVYST